MRRRDPARLDRLIAAATTGFVDRGFGRAKINQIAELAGIGPGTVYLYARDKVALFELAMLRALESPSVAAPDLPYRAHAQGAAQRATFRKALEATVHFPQLWVSLGRREVYGVLEEYDGILLEIASWMIRYRSAIRLVGANRLDWPDLVRFLDDLVWRELTRHLTAYLTTRIHTGHLHAAGEPAELARFTIESLVGFLVVGLTGGDHWMAGSEPGDPALAEREVRLVTRLLAAPLRPSGGAPPFPADTGH